MRAARLTLLAVMVIGAAVLVSIPERAGADGPPPGAVEIVIEDEPDEDVSIGTIPDDPEPAVPEAPAAASPKPESGQPAANPASGKTAPPVAAPPQAQTPAVVPVKAPPPPPPKPCPDGRPHDGGKDGVVPASGNTNDDCDHSVAQIHPSEPAAQPAANPKPDKPKPPIKASSKAKALVAQVVAYVQPAIANPDSNAPRAGYCRNGTFFDLVKDQPKWDPKYAGYVPAVNGACPPDNRIIKVVVLQPPPADPGTSRTGYCLNGKYADLLVNQPSWDLQWAGATPAKNGRC